MLLTRTPHNVLPLGAALLYTQVGPSSSTMLLAHRQFHVSPLRRQGSSAPSDKPSTSSSPPVKISEEVLRDRSEPGWAMRHETYTDKDFESTKIVFKKREGWGDRIAAFMVGVARFGFDVATQYPKHTQRFPRIKGSDTNMVKVGLPKAEEQVVKASRKAQGKEVQPDSKDLPEEMELGEMRKKKLCYGPEAWLVRIVFLESIAGVPGMVAASIRHLHSLRLLRRDGGFIAQLLEEAANERQHLLVALKLYKPGLFMRTMLILAQGVFYNFFFIFYLLSPRIAHRFVGILEEEAVVTYSRICDDIKQGRLPEWENYNAPAIAIDYWGLKPDAKILDVMLAIRCDEAGHRHVNHTIAGLKADDYNPFAYGHPPAALSGAKWGLTRSEAIEYFQAQDDKRRQRSPKSSSHESGGDDDKGPFQGRDGAPA